MRGTRWLLLVAIAAILGGIGYKYRMQREMLLRDRPAAPASLAAELNGKSQGWKMVEKDHATGRLLYEIGAESMQQASNSRVELKGVVMKLYAKDDKTYNLVKSAAASYDPAARSLFSEGETEITIGVPIEGEPAKQETQRVVRAPRRAAEAALAGDGRRPGIAQRNEMRPLVGDLRRSPRRAPAPHAAEDVVPVLGLEAALRERAQDCEVEIQIGGSGRRSRHGGTGAIDLRQRNGKNEERGEGNGASRGPAKRRGRQARPARRRRKRDDAVGLRLDVHRASSFSAERPTHRPSCASAHPSCCSSAERRTSSSWQCADHAAASRLQVVRSSDFGGPTIPASH